MTTIHGLKPPVARTLTFIHDHVAEHDRTPTYHELAAGLGCALSTVGTYLGVLEARHWITRPGAHHEPGAVIKVLRPWPPVIPNPFDRAPAEGPR